MCCELDSMSELSGFVEMKSKAQKVIEEKSLTPIFGQS